MPKLSHSLALGIFPILAFFLQACSTAGMFREIAEDREQISREASVASTQSRKPNQLSWREAIARQDLHDLSILRANERLEDLRRQRKNQWREWLPRPTLYVSFQNAFKNLGNLSSDDLRGAFVAPLTIPNPWAQTARAYQLALTEVQAEASLELTRRRQRVTLYRIFSEWERAGNEKAFSRQGNTLEEAVRARLQIQEMSLSEQERQQLQRSQLSQILNLPGVDVTPLAKTRPVIDYSSRYRRFTPGKNYGLLATQLYAYDIQGSILRQRGVELNRWPTPSFGTNTPAIYDTTRKNDELLGDLDAISLFGTWSKSFDLTGEEANEIRTAEENVRFVRENIRLRIDSEGREWERLVKRYDFLLKQRQLSRDRLSRLTSSGTRISTVQQDIEEARKLLSDLQSIERRKESLDIQLWLWDDSAW